MTQKKEYIDYCAEQEIKRVYERYETPDFMDYDSFAEVIRYFLNWQRERMMRKACEWLIDNTYLSISEQVITERCYKTTNEMIEEIKQAMMEE